MRLIVGACAATLAVAKPRKVRRKPTQPSTSAAAASANDITIDLPTSVRFNKARIAINGGDPKDVTNVHCFKPRVGRFHLPYLMDCFLPQGFRYTENGQEIKELNAQKNVTITHLAASNPDVILQGAIVRMEADLIEGGAYPLYVPLPNVPNHADLNITCESPEFVTYQPPNSPDAVLTCARPENVVVSSIVDGGVDIELDFGGSVSALRIYFRGPNTVTYEDRLVLDAIPKEIALENLKVGKETALEVAYSVNDERIDNIVSDFAERFDEVENRYTGLAEFV